MTNYIQFHSYKAGVGTTTTAVMTALKLAEQGRVLFVDTSESRDVHLLFGVSQQNMQQVMDSLWLLDGSDHGLSTDFVVVDAGLNEFVWKPRRAMTSDDIYQRVVVSNNTYQSLKPTASSRFPRDSHVMNVSIVNPQLTLTGRDCQMVLQRDGVIIPWDARIATRNDAGTWAHFQSTGLPNVHQPLTELVNHITNK